MEKEHNGWTLGELAEILNGELVGDPAIVILRPARSETSDPQSIVFAEDSKFLENAEASAAAAVLISRGMTATKAHVKVDSPKIAFWTFLAMCRREIPLGVGVHESAVISPSAKVDAAARVGAYVVVEAGATVAKGARIHPFCYVGDNCHVGPDAVLYPHVVLMQDVHVAERTIIHSGTVVGADGFGFVWDGHVQRKIPQVGGVTIGADVEIGALTAVDRAIAGNTIVSDGVKLDNFVQVAHNAQIGEHSVIAGQVGIAGSTKLGKRVTIGGQAGLRDGISLGDDVAITGGSAVYDSIEVPGVYGGNPTVSGMAAHRIATTTKRLPEMLSRLRKLEARIAELESK